MKDHLWLYKIDSNCKGNRLQILQRKLLKELDHKIPLSNKILRKLFSLQIIKLCKQGN